MKKTVLILGAGLSRASFPSSGTGYPPPLDSDFFKVALAIAPVQVQSLRKYLESKLGEYSNTLMKSLESTVAYLYLRAVDSRNNSIEQEQFISILHLINEVIAKSTNKIKVGHNSLLYRFIKSELGKAGSPENLTIITFNYDLAIERVLASMAGKAQNRNIFAFPGCYRFNKDLDILGISGQTPIGHRKLTHDGVSLLKLHGSLNWASVHTSSKPSKDAILNPERKLRILDATNIPVGLSWKRKQRTTHVKPIIVPPISGKRGVMHEDLTPIWNLASNRLSEADRVVIAGYSCPPNDLEARFLLSESLRSNPSKRLYVIDKDPYAASKFVDLCGVKHITTYTELESWVEDSSKY